MKVLLVPRGLGRSVNAALASFDPAIQPATPRSTTHAAYAATVDSRIASQRWPHVTHRQSAPVSSALCGRDVGVWHSGHIKDGGGYVPSWSTAAAT